MLEINPQIRHKYQPLFQNSFLVPFFIIVSSFRIFILFFLPNSAYAWRIDRSYLRRCSFLVFTDILSLAPTTRFLILETKEAQAILQLLLFFPVSFLRTALAAAARNGEVAACVKALSAGEGVDQRFEVNREIYLPQ